MCKIKYLKIISVGLSVGLLALTVWLFYGHSFAAACTDDDCTNKLSVAIEVNFQNTPTISANGNYTAGSAISDASSVAPSSANVTVVDTGPDAPKDRTLFATTTSSRSISGAEAFYKVTIPPIELTGPQWDDDYSGQGTGAGWLVEVCSSIIDSPGSSPCVFIEPTTSESVNPNETINVSLAGTNIVSTASKLGGTVPPGCEGSSQQGSLAPGTTCPSTTYPPGCYTMEPTVSGQAETPEPCPSGALDNYGNPISSKSCYIAEAGPPAPGETSRPWDLVSCSNLTTDLPDPAPQPESQQSSCSSDSSNCGPICQSSSWSLSWLACSVINEMEDIEFYAKTALNDLLKTPIITFTGKYCGSSSSSVPAINKATSCIYKVWSNMRLYADVILLLAFLVVVYSEAVGGGVMDAYTVKKMLPRILLAAILINLSIYLVAAALDITNILGAGLYDVLRAPFSSSGTWVINLNGIGGSVIGGSTLSLLLGGGALAISSIIDPSIGGAVLDAAIGMLFLVGVPVILAILSVILTLIVRTALLYFLIMISPIAFALFCLPNTERVFKSWWKHLAQTLLVYPILAVVFAMAGIIGVIMSAIGLSSGTIGWFGELISAVAVVSPLFLIPFSFKIAGGAMGQVSDAVTNLRGRAQGALFGDERDPNSNRNRFRRRLQADRSELGLTGGQIGAMANPFGGGLRARRNAVRSRRIADRTRHGAETVENDAIWQANRTNEKFLQAHANRELAVESMEAARNAGDTATASAWDQSIAAADQVHRNKATMMASANAWAATGFEHKMGPQGYNDLAKTISRITGTELQYDQHGNVVGARAGQATAGDYGLAMNNAQFALRQAGRYDLGGINNGKGYDLGLGLSKTSGYTAGNAKTEVFQAGALRYLGASGDQQSISDAISAKLRVSAQNNDAYAMKSADDDIRKWHAQLLDAYASPTQGNKEEILKQLRAIQDPSSRLSHETIAELQHNYNMYINRRPGVDPNQIETP